MTAVFSNVRLLGYQIVYGKKCVFRYICRACHLYVGNNNLVQADPAIRHQFEPNLVTMKVEATCFAEGSQQTVYFLTY